MNVNGTAASYGYNADGLRMSKKMGTSTQQFLWDPSTGLPQLLSDGNESYVYGPGGLPVEQVRALQPITYAASGAATDLTSSSMTISLNAGGGPASTQANDEIMLGVSAQSGSKVNTPSGYTLIATQPSTGTTPDQTWLFAKKSGGGESSVTVTEGGSLPFPMVGVAVAYRGTDPNSLTDGAATKAASPAGPSVTVSSINATVAGDRLVLFQGAEGTNAGYAGWSTPSPMNDFIWVEQPLQGAAWGDEAIASAGATGDRTATFMNSESLSAIMVALKPIPTTYYFHHDQIGSTRALSDPAGNVVSMYQFDAYGNTIGQSGTVSTPLLYTGQYQDSESGLYYLRARYYDPATGLFISRDPAVATTREPYAYAGDNPLNSTDATGLSTDGFCYSLEGVLAPGGMGGSANFIGCLVMASDGSIGITASYGFGPVLASGHNASLMAAEQVSNANSLQELEGWFVYGEGGAATMADVVPVGASIGGFAGCASDGRFITGGVFGVGLSAPGFSIGAGPSNTFYANRLSGWQAVGATAWYLAMKTQGSSAILSLGAHIAQWIAGVVTGH